MFKAIPKNTSRFEYWSAFVNEKSLKTVAEIGVWKGDFAKKILDDCPSIKDYYLVDPWRKMNDWNKPFNFKEDLGAVYEEAMEKLKNYANKTKVLRG